MPATRIGIVAYAQAQEAAVLGLRDLLDAASLLRRQEVPDAEAVEVVVLRTPDWSGRFDAVIVPPSLGGVPPEGSPMVPALRAAHADGAVLCSVCVGAFVLGETGLLDGREVTTHWALADDLQARHPRCRVDRDRLLIDQVDILTAGGVMAWVDLGLSLVARYLSPATALQTARFLLVDPGGREQRYYVPFHPPMAHGDAAVLRAQRWLHTRVAKPVSVDEAAEVAALSRRTFQRRFRARTGFGFSEYVQRLRVSTACGRLESTAETVEQVAWAVGYEDAGALRRAFQRVLGLTPGEYRRRFQLRATPSAEAS